MLDSLFFHSPTRDVFIKQEHLDIIRHLVSYEDTTTSGYCPSMLQWRIEDNKLLTEDNIDDIYIAMQFITMCAEMTDAFKIKHDVEPYHESLLRRLYLEQDEDEDGFITTGFKRPFGNSYVVGDIAEEMHRFGFVVYKDDIWFTDEGIFEGICEAEYLKFISILKAFMQEFVMNVYYFSPNKANSPLSRWNNSVYSPSSNYDWKKKLNLTDEHNYLHGWIPSIVEERDSKIEDIIK